MRHSFIDKYSYLDSPIHHISAEWKLLLAPIFILIITVIPKNYMFVITSSLYFIALLVIILLSKVPVGFILKRSLLIFPFLFFVIILNMIFKDASLYLTMVFLIRALLSILILIVMISTTKFHVLMKTLEKWKFPHIFILIFSFMYRYFFILQDEMEKMVRVVQLRSGKKKKMEILRVYAHIIGHLFIKSYDRSENIYNAMVMRGYQTDSKSGVKKVEVIPTEK